MQNVEDFKGEMVETLIQVRNYVDQLGTGCSAIRESFQSDEGDNGIAMLANFLEGLGWVSEALAVSGPAQVDYGVEVDLDDLSKALEPALEALEHKDYGLIGDVLEYEVRPVLTGWSTELEKIQVS